MPFDTIECVNPTAIKAVVPADGIHVSARTLTIKSTGRITRFIKATIGADLARKIGLTKDRHSFALGFGSGVDAGKIRVAVDDGKGQFATKRQVSGQYGFTINKDTADGLFATDFTSFARPGLEALRPADGAPPHFVFRASDEMLAVDD